MKYKRSTKKVFSISHIMDQLVDYLKEEKSLPEKIYLPPEEYFYINYLASSMEKQITTFLGIPLEVNYEEQDIPFHI